MSKYFETTQGKLLSAYGGPGSLVEMTHHAIRVSDLGDWKYLQKGLHKHYDESGLDNPVFLKWLKEYFPNLQHLYRMPENSLNERRGPTDNDSMAKAWVFPQWFYCTRCKRLDKAANWHQNWKEQKPPNGVNKNKFLAQHGHGLSECVHCYQKHQRGYLEQIRFVLASEQGQLADIPWDLWILSELERDKNAASSELDPNGFVELNLNLKLQGKQLRYKTGQNDTEFGSIQIELHENAASKEPIFTLPLRGLFNKQFSPRDFPRATGVRSYHQEDREAPMRVMMRTSQSLYYPQFASSIYFPQATISEQEKSEQPPAELTSKLKQRLQKLFDGFADDNSVKDAGDLTLSLYQISKLRELHNRGEELPADLRELEDEPAIEEQEQEKEEQEEDQLREIRFRSQELQTLMNYGQNSNQSKDSRLEVNQVSPERYERFQDLLKVYRLDRLTLHKVQVGYTRLKPAHNLDAFLRNYNSPKSDLPKSVYLTRYGRNEYYLPAAELSGEGLLFTMDNKKISEWLEAYVDAFQERMGLSSSTEKENKIQKMLDQVRQCLIHTFSHLVIKELEFLCGYPAASLCERLYGGDDNLATLIYTTAGSEGSYGGLVALADNNRLGRLLETAIERAKDCANDPVCIETLNSEKTSGGACYDCAYLPETSCEQFNHGLDRAFLIDEQFGFFATMRQAVAQQ